MPRPSTRPYECVRRAWHSERHQPMRGSLIQEIFRVVNESHGSATKKNKEWQEKLPIVVLKAEEIMYFKANSEAEYVDLKTLWERVNDAIDTIIKRDESSETGDLLHPCIEAALHLGCTPRRATRSQRNNSGVCYLGSRDGDAPSSSPVSLRDKIHGNPKAYSPFLVPPLVQFIPPNTMNASAFHSFETKSGSKVQNHTVCDKRFPFFHENASRCVNPSLPTSPSPHSVYPLHFSPNLPKGDAGRVWKTISLQDLDANCNAPSHNSIPHWTNAPLSQPVTECDLSLRLGPAGVCETQSSGGKLGVPPPQLDWLATQSRDQNIEEVLKKQKVGISHLYEDNRPFCHPMKLPLKHLVWQDEECRPLN